MNNKRYMTACTAFLAVLVLLVLTSCGDRSSDEARSRSARPPNVVLVTIDTLRADYLGCYGMQDISTPAIDSLAASGVLFEKAYCQVPTTAPSHSSILTSMYPRSHGVLNNAQTLPDGFVTLPEVLKGNGYDTAAFLGVWVLGEKYGFSQGIDRFEIAPDDKRPSQVGDWLASRTSGSQPFFLWLHMFGPHRPYAPPEPYEEMYDTGYEGDYNGSVEDAKRIYDEKLRLNDRDLKHVRSLYKGEVSYIDELMSEILARLEESGQIDDTLIVFTADHGEVLYEHEYYFGHSFSLYQPALHVPLIIRYPGKTPVAERVRETVESVDIMPTVLDMVGMGGGGPVEMEGRSLLPLIRPGEGGRWKEKAAFSETFAPEGRDNKSAVNYGGLKLIKYLDAERTELYDLAADPGEKLNIYDGNAEKALPLERYAGRMTLAPAGQAGGRGPLSEDEKERLRSLGYVQ